MKRWLNLPIIKLFVLLYFFNETTIFNELNSLMILSVYLAICFEKINISSNKKLNTFRIKRLITAGEAAANYHLTDE